jgi:hypothetical protein
MDSNGTFLVSLDFELFWGIHDKYSISNYGKSIENVWEVLPKIIHDLDCHNVKSTFATVGFVFASGLEDLKKYYPEKKPNYKQRNLSPYPHLSKLESNSRYYFAPELIDLLINSKNHEIGTHTFSHFYCLGDGQRKEEFDSDLKAAVSIAASKKIKLKSIVFPRNQVNKNYLQVLKDNGITSYRGTEKSWFYSFEKGPDESIFKRVLRLLDSYVNISGDNTFKVNKKDSTPFNFPSSRFLRPYNPKLRVFEKYRIKRILKSMEYAAKNNEVFHLWWHPHNFSKNQKENFKTLKAIIEHYTYLNKKYNFQSLTMEELAKNLKTE